MTMVNEPRTDEEVNRELKSEAWKAAGNVAVIAGQVCFMALEFFVMCMTVVGAFVVGALRGVRHRK